MESATEIGNMAVEIRLFLQRRDVSQVYRMVKCEQTFNSCFEIILDVHGSVHHSTNHLEITNKMRACVRIYYSNVY